MNKKVIALIVVIILIVIIGVVAYFMSQNSNENGTNNVNQEELASQTEENNQATNTAMPEDNNVTDNNTTSGGKTLVVLIGYPIWWGIAAWPVDTFVKANDFTGKTVIPFCTSSSSGLGQSGELLAEEAGTGNWLEGQRFSSNPSDSDINSWADSIK